MRQHCFYDQTLAFWWVLCPVFGGYFFQGFSEVSDVFAPEGGPGYYPTRPQACKNSDCLFGKAFLVVCISQVQQEMLQEPCQGL